MRNKNVMKKATSIALIFALVVGNTAVADAKKITKQESVYVLAGTDGGVNSITVSDWLQNAKDANGDITDSSDLTDIVNVKGNETFTQNGKEISWTSSDNDIYYQGKSNKDLPVSMSITYELDGKEIKASELPGKSGKLKMHVTYTNKSKTKKKINGKEEEIYTPFVMVTGMILSTDNFANVEIDNGKVINDGSNCIVVGMGLPGMAESLDLDKDDADKIPSDFTMTADVTDFSMGNTFTFASANLFNDVDLDDVEDLDDLEDQLDKLTDASEKLVDGSEKLSKNLKKYNSKMGELKKSLKTYQKDGVKKLTNGISTLAKNGPALVKGVNQYVNGVNSLASGTKAYIDGADKIASGNKQLYEAVKDMPSQINTFDEGLLTYTSAVDAMGTTENVTKLKSGASAVAGGIGSVNTGLKQLQESYANNDAMIAQLKQTEAALTAAGQDASTITTLRVSLEKITAGQKAAIEKLIESTSETSTLQTGATAVSNSVATVMDGLQTLSKSSSKLTSASSTLKTSVPTLVSSAKQLKEGGEKLTKNDKALKTGANKLVKSGKTLKSSAKQLNKGMTALNKGGKSLGAATVKLVSGVKQLTDASGKLADGSDTLADGMDEFNKDGIQEIKNMYDDDISPLIDRLKAIVDAGKDYATFSGMSKAMDGEVKFIIETDAIEKEDE
ncbi:MAG: hypothetical protein MRZ36_07375 [Eubacterium sp.]|nr:hypothetical protein [Eubacterium sp.]